MFKFSPNGILSELCRLLGDVSNNEEYTFRNLIYNLNYVHRAYDITYSSSRELFFPISNPIMINLFTRLLLDLFIEHTSGAIPKRN